jgi:hypothetical protein
MIGGQIDVESVRQVLGHGSSIDSNTASIRLSKPFRQLRHFFLTKDALETTCRDVRPKLACGRLRS